MEERTYTDKDIRQIIDTALRLQQKSSVPGATGQTLDDVVAIGSELGVSREMILHAAQELEMRRTSGVARRLLGGELVQTEVFTIPGEAPERALEDLTGDLPRLTSLQGQANIVGRHFGWQNTRAADQTWDLRVDIRRRDQETTVQVQNRNGLMAVGMFVGLMGSIGIGIGVGVGVGVGVGELGSALFSTLVPLACLGGSYVAARGFFGWITRVRRRKIRRIAEHIRSVIS